MIQTSILTSPLCVFARTCFVWLLFVATTVNGAETTEYRRALLIGNEDAELEAVLKQRGFLISDGTITDSLDSIPHHSFNLIYYRGIAEHRDGKWHLSSESLVAQDLINHLQNRNVARHNVLLFDLQNPDDNTRKTLHNAVRGIVGRNHRGGLAVVNKSPSEADSLAAQFIEWLKSPESNLRDTFTETAHVSAETEEPVVLRGKPSRPISSPGKLIPGGSAGDEWLAPDGMNFIWCPPAEYMMGDPDFYDAQPVSISIDQGFWISKFELTRLDASTERMNAGGSFTYGRQPMHPAGALRLEMLVEQIHKKQAPEGWTYDLPSEAEWEYAARAGSKADLPAPIEKLGQFANFADRSLFNANEEVHFIFAHREIDDGTAHGFSNIGRYLPNAWGIHDMFGNASEYCAGYYAEEFSGKVNYHLKNSRDRGIAILRGGAWCTPVKHLHVAYRTSYNGDENQPYSGARLVIRQGKRITVTHAELVAAKKAEEAAARGKE